MSKLANRLTSLRSTPRTASIALATMLSAACFRYQPAARPDAQPSDGARGDSADASELDATAMDASDTGAIEDGTIADSADVVGMDATDDRPTADVPSAGDADAGDSRASDGEAGVCASPDASAPDGGGPIAAGDCAVNNGGCSQYAQCVSYCGGLRRCACAPGLALGGDGHSCSGLLLLSKTSTSNPGTNFGTRNNFDLSISTTGRYVAFASVVNTGVDAQRCFSFDARRGGSPTEISAAPDAMGVERRPEACFAPHVTDDGRRALFVTVGLHRSDPEPAPMWAGSVLATTRWPYYRDDGGAPTRVNVWQTVMPEQSYMEGFNNFRFARDGRRMAFACRTNLDPSVTLGDNNMDFYSASIPIQPWEPLFEDVNDNRTVPSNRLPYNARDMDMAGDGVTLLFGTPRAINGESHTGTDIFARRVGVRGPNPTINMSPDPGSSGDSRWPTGSFDGSKVLFVSNSPAIVGSSAQEYVISARTGSAVRFIRTGIAAADPLASTMSDDGNLIAVLTRRAFAIAGEPMDTNGALDYYVLDVSDPMAIRAITRLGLTATGLEPGAAHTQGGGVRLAGDGSAVVFVTDQQLMIEDNNGSVPDVYMRVFR